MAAKQINIDYHQLLGVNRNADEKTILKAFRQLSRHFHPDKVAGEEEKMKLLTLAKITLLDPEKRAKYETNYDYGDNQSNLTDALHKLNIGHRPSDDYRTKIDQWKKEYQSIHIIVNMDMFGTLMQKFEQSLVEKRTVFDLGADQLNNQMKSNQVMFEELQAIFMAQDFDNLAQYILTHQCRSVLSNLYEDVKPKQHEYKLPDKLKALLQIIKSSGTLHANGHQNRTKGLYEAVFIHPTNECMRCVLKLINNRMTDAHKDEVIDKIMNQNLFDEEISNKQYMYRLKCDPVLRSILKYENGIHNQNIGSMEKAMLYIDLCMVDGHPIVLANSLVLASRELIAYMVESLDVAELYALKNCVIELCYSVLHCVSTYANPISQLKYSIHVIRLIKRANQILADSVGGQILNSNKDKRPLIGKLDQSLLERANHCVLKSIKVSPLIDTKFDMTSDVLYINVINNNLLEMFYQWNIDTYTDHPSAHLYQYSLMEGSWKNWFDAFKFEDYRRKSIEIILDKTNISMLDVARTMKSEISYLIPTMDPVYGKTDTFESKPMINRCEEGWILPDENYLNMGNISFNSVDGLIIDIEQGTFEIIVSTDEQISPLCDSQDIDEIVIKGLCYSVFSLDQADFELDYHPFQLMRYSPKSLDNSRYLSTLLAADYLLKMIATDTEVSAQPPFEIKQAVDGFLKSMPTDLRQFIMMKKSTNFEKIHRFWIENGDIPYYKNVDENGKIIYEFYYTPMLVKKNLMKKNSHGELVDDSDTSEDELTDESDDESDIEPNSSKKKISTEARFTRRLTQYYDLIGCYFPVLLRLRELAKLSVISMILKNTHHALEETKNKFVVPRNDVQNILEHYRRQIIYPVCTESRVDEIYMKVLRDNDLYDDSRVIWTERIRVKNDIRSNLNSADERLLIDFPEQLSEHMGLTNTQELGKHVSDWIKHGQSDALIDYLSTAIYDKKIEKLSKFGNNLKKLGVNLADHGNTKPDESDSGCKWVPATFSKFDERRVYGGVFLRPKLNLQNNRGFQGFQATTKNAGSSGGFSGGSSGGSPPSKPPKNKNKEKVMKTFGQGKGWPKTPIRVGDTYFGRPGTSHKTHQSIIITFGPSGWPKLHNPRYSTKKAAEEAAARKNRGRDNCKGIFDGAHGKIRMIHGTATDQQKKDYHNKNKKGDRSNHFHSTDENGEKLKDGVHHLCK